MTATYKRVPVERLIIDSRYQRPLNEHRIGRMIDDFRPAQLGTLEVSHRPGGQFAVFDGQHRLAALKALGKKTAPCLVHEGIDAQEEADLFVRLQRERRPATPVERFKAQLFSGDHEAAQIAGALTASGFKIGSGEHDVKAVSSVEKLASRHGIEIVRRTFETIRDAWFGDPGSLDGSVIGGLGEVIGDYSDRWDSKHVDRLRLQAPIDIKRRAQGKRANLGGSAHIAVAAEIRKTAGLTGRPRRKAAEVEA